jgi:molybdopterin-containing oxidoreductase family iron-sulfur binding subunit
VIVSFDADFLGTWISPVEYTAAWRGRSAHHVQFESRLSLTGSKATRRIRVTPPELVARLNALAAAILGSAPADDLTQRLQQARGKSLVISGSQDPAVQAVVNAINQGLGNYGATLDIERPSYQRQGSDRDLQALLAEIDQGKVQTLLIHQANPVYDLPAIDLKKVPRVIAFAERLDETASQAEVVCPTPHYLESWNDAEPVAGLVSLSQPVIPRLGSTRPATESLSAWQPLQSRDRKGADFESGFYLSTSPTLTPKPFDPRSIPPAPIPETSPLHLVLYPKPSLLEGRHAYNPWLQELPDPISKVSWDNYASLSPATAARLGISQGDIVKLGDVELPAYLQPGQADDVVAVALGYGRSDSARFAKVGPRWFQARTSLGDNGLVGKRVVQLPSQGLTLTKTGHKIHLACTQDHHTLTSPLHPEPRPIIQDTTSSTPSHPTAELWPRDHPTPGHRWAMVVDLDACTGCSACVVACQVENNIPVVGRDEIRRRREMHWIRIDRYYSGPPDNVEVAFQPMMCQHCEHASCETVCPVLATVHSEEGLNQQVYNRCVGTRYCANNCPYKARRFNWFDYPRDDRLANMVLNPDVTVRSRGVMEKCTFCVQRIQEAKIEAKREGRTLQDGEIQTACQQSCPAQAIVFGDIHDPNSRVSRLASSGRAYKVLEELNVRPSVTYLKVVRHG